MARTRVRRRRGTDSGAAWISYSDMMAALLLLFVLVLCYSVYQYFLMLETKTAEIDEKAALLLQQEEQLLSQASTILEQSKEIEMKTAEISDKEQSLATSNLELQKSQALVLEQEGTLALQAEALSQKEDELEVANGLLLLRESQLSKAEEDLAASQLELEESRLELEKSSEIMALQQEALDNQQKKLDDLVGVKTRIITDLSQELSRAKLKATVDPATGDIVLESTVFFDVGKNTIKDSGKELLDTFIPVYLGVLLSPEYADYLGEIIIEGHTDTSGDYLMNLELSQDRALSVVSYCLEMPGLTDEQRDLLRTILTAKGRSFSNPIYDENGNVDMDASRRVEFKFSLKDAEMIEEIRTILDQDYGMDLPMEAPDDAAGGEG